METKAQMASALAAPWTGTPLQDPLGESTPWPQDAMLCQPLEQVQQLLPERASCLAVKTYLRMCRLPFEEHHCENAEFMSPGGRLTKLPLLRLGSKLFTEFEPIVGHVEVTQLSHALSSWLSLEQREDMRCLVKYVENTFTLAELHHCYMDAEVFATHTQPRSGATHPWPLSLLRRNQKRRDALRLLRVYQWHDLDDYAAQCHLHDCCQLLSDKQADSEADSKLLQSYMCGPQLCELDALVFGHLAAILSSQLANPMLSDTVAAFPRLVTYCRRLDEEFHEGKQLAGLD